MSASESHVCITTPAGTGEYGAADCAHEHGHEHAHLGDTESVAEALAADPSKTAPMRERYGEELRSALIGVREAMREGVDERDAFGLGEAREELARRIGSERVETLAEVPDGFDFDRRSDKERAFDTWLERQLRNDVLVPNRSGNSYLEAGYARGVRNATGDLERVGWIETGSSSPVEAIVRRSVHEDTLQSVYTRNYRQLQGLTADVGSDMSRVLANGLATGQSPNAVADDLAEVIGRVDPDGASGALARSTTIARTEMMHSFHEASFARYDEYGVERVEIVLASGACDRCIDLASRGPFRPSEIRGSLPIHPQCRCATAPVPP